MDFETLILRSVRSALIGMLDQEAGFTGYGTVSGGAFLTTQGGSYVVRLEKTTPDTLSVESFEPKDTGSW